MVLVTGSDMNAQNSVSTTIMYTFALLTVFTFDDFFFFFFYLNKAVRLTLTLYFVVVTCSSYDWRECASERA